MEGTGPGAPDCSGGSEFRDGFAGGGGTSGKLGGAELMPIPGLTGGGGLIGADGLTGGGGMAKSTPGGLFAGTPLGLMFLAGMLFIGGFAGPLFIGAPGIAMLFAGAPAPIGDTGLVRSELLVWFTPAPGPVLNCG